MRLSDSTRDLYKLLQERAKASRLKEEQADPRKSSGSRSARRRAGAPPAKKKWTFPPKVKQFLPHILAVLFILALFTYVPPINNEVPQYLIGTWRSSTPGYEDRYLVFTRQSVVFGTGGYSGDVNVIYEVQNAPVLDGAREGSAGRELFTIQYMKSDKLKSTLSFYYNPSRKNAITFKNQKHLTWEKER